MLASALERRYKKTEYNATIKLSILSISSIWPKNKENIKGQLQHRNTSNTTEEVSIKMKKTDSIFIIRNYFCNLIIQWNIMAWKCWDAEVVHPHYHIVFLGILYCVLLRKGKHILLDFSVLVLRGAWPILGVLRKQAIFMTSKLLYKDILIFSTKVDYGAYSIFNINVVFDYSMTWIINNLKYLWL